MDKNQVKEIEETVKSLINDHGYITEMNNWLCKGHKADHDNCIGCLSHPGCKRLSAILLAMISTPPDRFESIVSKILDKDWDEEIPPIPVPPLFDEGDHYNGY